MSSWFTVFVGNVGMGSLSNLLLLGGLGVLAMCPGCGKEARRFGKPVDPVATVTVADLVADPERFLDQPAVIQGRIATVCQTAGCWCTIEDGNHQLYVSITAFALPADTAGRQCRMRGKLTLRNDRLTFLAAGIDVLAD